MLLGKKGKGFVVKLGRKNAPRKNYVKIFTRANNINKQILA